MYDEISVEKHQDFINFIFECKSKQKIYNPTTERPINIDGSMHKQLQYNGVIRPYLINNLKVWIPTKEEDFKYPNKYSEKLEEQKLKQERKKLRSLKNMKKKRSEYTSPRIVSPNIQTEN